jgi:hypothetical protein
MKFISTCDGKCMICEILYTSEKYSINIEYDNKLLVNYTLDDKYAGKGGLISSFNMGDYIESLDNSLYSSELKSCIKIMSDLYDNTELNKINNAFVCIISFIVYKMKNDSKFYSPYYYAYSIDRDGIKYCISDSIRSAKVNKNENNILKLIEKIIKRL